MTAHDPQAALARVEAAIAGLDPDTATAARRLDAAGLAPEIETAPRGRDVPRRPARHDHTTTHEGTTMTTTRILRPATSGRVKVADLVGQIVAMSPHGRDTYGAGADAFDYIDTLVIAGQPDNFVTHDHVWVTQTVLMQQLDRTTAAAPWVVGRLERAGRAYVLADLSDADFAAAAAAIDAYEARQGRSASPAQDRDSDDF